jgi:two-component system, NarL family, response regulator NreC
VRTCRRRSPVTERSAGFDVSCCPTRDSAAGVDDHAVVRAGIRLVLDGAPGISVVAEAGTEVRAVVMARAHQPDVIVLDVLLPGTGGLELIPQLLEISPKSRVLMLSSSAEPGTVERALEAGATGYSINAPRAITSVADDSAVP